MSNIRKLFMIMSYFTDAGKRYNLIIGLVGFIVTIRQLVIMKASRLREIGRKKEVAD